METPQLSTVYLYFSSACNLCCRHCWIEPEYLAAGKANEDLALDKIIAALEECIPLGLNTVKITGGEPFLRTDIFGLLDYLTAKKMNISIETNGTLIKEKEAAALKKASVHHIAVSLDGPTAHLHEELRQSKGSFKDTIAGIGHLKKSRVGNIQIIMCLWRENASAVNEMTSFAKDLGVNSLKINPLSSSCWRTEKMEEEKLLLTIQEIIGIYRGLHNEGAQNGLPVIFDIPPALLFLDDFKKSGSGTCGIKHLLGIIADGKISICGIGKTMEKLIFGEVGKDRIKDIWENSAVLKQIREEIPQKLQGVCGKCLFRFYCLGKCRAAAFYETENLLAPFSICQQAYEHDFFPKSRLISKVNR